MSTDVKLRTVSSIKFEERLGNTIMAKHISSIDSGILSKLSSREAENMSIDTLQRIIDDNMVLKAQLINLYNGTLGTYAGVENIPDDIKAVQGALLDGICYGYNIEKDTVDLYTMNLDVVDSMLKDEKKQTTDYGKKIIEDNLVGRLRSYRIDVSYEMSSEYFSYKIVRHKSVIDMDEESGIVLVPYLEGLRLMQILKFTLDANGTLYTMQYVGDIKKERFITKNSAVLAKFCDDPTAVKGIEPDYFPLKAYFYAPVVGAPSYSSMVTNIHLFRLASLKGNVTEAKMIKFGVEKDDNSMLSFVLTTSIGREMSRIIAEFPEKFDELKPNMPKSNLLGEMTAETFSEIGFKKYMDSLSVKELSVLAEKTPRVRDCVMSMAGVFKGKSFKEIGKDEFDDAVKDSLVRVIIHKSDCSLSSVLCTNNKNILARVYGESYYSYYESKGSRLYKALRMIQEEGCSVTSAFGEMNLMADLSETVLNMCREAVDNGLDLLDDDFVSDVKKEMGIRKSYSSNSNATLVRTITGYITERGVIDYYRSINTDIIVKVMKLQ